ncbi:unnamed protein product [Durusdinium trenchii]|uniref:Ubiquitin-like domain-containing protein n=1 Tax=Durusdinium trenchii TaxID=1381693 RepID=A0ABP0NVF8_9DINO
MSASNVPKETSEEITLTVALLSGEGAKIVANLDWTVNQLRLQAQWSLRVGICSLVNSEGEVLKGRSTLAHSGLVGGDLLHATVRQARLVSTRQSYAFALMRGDGSVVSWGSRRLGGDSSRVQQELRDVEQIQASGGAFAAIRADGQVITWGDSSMGGKTGWLENVKQIEGRWEASPLCAWTELWRAGAAKLVGTACRCSSAS